MKPNHEPSEECERARLEFYFSIREENLAWNIVTRAWNVAWRASRSVAARKIHESMTPEARRARAVKAGKACQKKMRQKKKELAAIQ